MKLGRLQKTLLRSGSLVLCTKDLRAPRHASAEAIAAELEEEETVVQKHPGVEQALRDGHCGKILFYREHHLFDGTPAKFADTRLSLVTSRQC